MCGVQICKNKSSHSTQDYHSISFRLFLVTLVCVGSVRAFRLLCCIVMCLLRLALFANLFPHVSQSSFASLSNSRAAAHFPKRSYSPTILSNIYFSPTTVNSKQKDVTGTPPTLWCWEGVPRHVEMVRTKCQPKSWSGQNANHGKKSPGQNANLGWHFFRLAFCPVGI